MKKATRRSAFLGLRMESIWLIESSELKSAHFEHREYERHQQDSGEKTGRFWVVWSPDSAYLLIDDGLDGWQSAIRSEEST